MNHNEPKTSRRKLLTKTATLSTAIATGLSASPALAKRSKRLRWRLAMAIPKTLPVWGECVETFATNLREMSQGQIDIRVYGAGEIVPALEVFDAVKKGRIQLAHSAAYYWQGKMPAAPFFTSVPFGLPADGMRAWMQAGGQKLWDELYAPHNIKPLMAGNTGLQMGGWFNREIKSPKDFKGLKMRMPGLGSKVIEKLGAKPVLVPGGEIYTNLATGVIDATEWVGPFHDYILGLHKAAKYYYYPGWHEPGPALELLINKKSWDGLPAHLQVMFTTAAAALDRDMYAKWVAKDAHYLAKIKKETKVQIKAFPKSVISQLKIASEATLEEVSKANPLSKRIYNSYRSFQAEYNDFQSVTQWSYVDAMRYNSK
jgi:TRAP-type mannitol/chloroaromatic compound transport system substrate-binding protein